MVPLTSFLFTQDKNTSLPVESLLSLSLCLGIPAIMFGISAAIGNYLRYGMLDLFDKRLSQIAKKAKQKEQEE